MTRLRFSGYHLVISLLIGISIFSLFWFIWYPSPMMYAIGGEKLFLVILGVDVSLGPLLTFVVYKNGKKSLPLDLAAIGLLQVAAMAYGVSTLFEGRPVYVAALGNRFQVVVATEVTDANLTKAKTTLPIFGPKWVGTTAPVEQSDIYTVELLERMIGGGRGHLPQLHIPYDAMAHEVLAQAKPLDELRKQDPAVADEVANWLQGHAGTSKSQKYELVSINHLNFPVLLDGESGAVLGIAPYALKR